LQCGAVCCSVLQCVAVHCSALQCGCIAGLIFCELLMCCSVLQCGAVWCTMCCSALQCVAVRCSVVQCVAVCYSVLQCSALQCGTVFSIGICAGCMANLICRELLPCCSVVQCVAVRCSVLQCGAECYRVLQCVEECCIFDSSLVVAQLGMRLHYVSGLLCKRAIYMKILLQNHPNDGCLYVYNGIMCQVCSICVLQCDATCCSMFQ